MNTTQKDIEIAKLIKENEELKDLLLGNEEVEELQEKIKELQGIAKAQARKIKELEVALENIMKHQKISAGSAVDISVTYNIAKRALELKERE